ncbi:MAG TPA: heme-copper oxidase subunit III [Candidatus Obscuribacterales bacterium]
MSKALQGMLLFIASEATFFLMLVMSYVNFHKVIHFSAESYLDPLKTGMFSIALFASSFTMWCAENSFKKQNRGWLRFWLAITIILGTIFIAGQGIEYADLIEHHITISRDLFGTTFFTLTGFHGLHVIIGLLLLLSLLGLCTFGRKIEPTSGGMHCIAYYWHFVDVVWVFIFSVVYLWRYV